MLCCEISFGSKETPTMETENCIICLERLFPRLIHFDELATLILEIDDRARRELLMSSDNSSSAHEEEQRQGYSFVGKEDICRRKHLLCETCMLRFATTPTNISCPSCRSDLHPQLRILHALQIERRRADFMARQHAEVRDLADQFAERVTQLYEQCDRAASNSTKRLVYGCIHDNYGMFCKESNNFTENIRYKTRTPDKNEIMCLMRIEQ